MNYESLLTHLARDGADDAALPSRTVYSDPVLISRLPPSAVLQAEARREVLRSFKAALLRDALGSGCELNETEEIVSNANSIVARPGQQDCESLLHTSDAAAPSRKIAFWELLRAIEAKDIQCILEIRQTQFELLTQKEGGVTPLLHCLRLGDAYSDIAIILVGAYSRWVNELAVESGLDVVSRHLAAAVRANLKLAINASIQANQTELISSYLSVIVASSGEKWLREARQSVAVALRAGPSGQAVRTANTATIAFATAELRTLTMSSSVTISSVDDYLANATADLLLMAAWDLVPFSTDELPLWSFARDERIYKTFSEHIEQARAEAAYHELPKLLRTQISLLHDGLGSRAKGYREKVEALERCLDH